jgi:hypothetical protein
MNASAGIGWNSRSNSAAHATIELEDELSANAVIMKYEHDMHMRV